MTVYTKEADVLEALARRFAAPEYAFLRHVRNGTGYAKGKVRTLDAMALGLYPSKGLELHGFEVKLKRGDFLREMKQPDKNAEFIRSCQRFWLVIGDSKVATVDEVPANWGLLVPHGDGLRQAKAAPLQHAEDIDRGLLCAMMRAATDSKAQRAAVKTARDEGRREADARVARMAKSLKKALDELDELRSKCSPEVSAWADAVRVAAGCEYGVPWQDLDGARKVGALLQLTRVKRDGFRARLDGLEIRCERGLAAVRDCRAAFDLLEAAIEGLEVNDDES